MRAPGTLPISGLDVPICETPVPAMYCRMPVELPPIEKIVAFPEKQPLIAHSVVVTWSTEHSTTKKFSNIIRHVLSKFYNFAHATGMSCPVISIAFQTAARERQQLWGNWCPDNMWLNFRPRPIQRVQYPMVIWPIKDNLIGNSFKPLWWVVSVSLLPLRRGTRSTCGPRCFLQIYWQHIKHNAIRNN